jgi:hypothetical protein
MGIDTDRCEFKVQQAQTELDRVMKLSERQVNNLALQIIKLQDCKATEEAAFKEQVRALEQEKNKTRKLEHFFCRAKQILNSSYMCAVVNKQGWTFARKT